MQSFEMPEFYVPYIARCNPHLDSARLHAKPWARSVGILDGESHQIWDEGNFDAHDYALLCAYIHPEAPIPELNLMTDWNIWAFYVDDYFLHTYQGHHDRSAAKQYLDRILVFMPVDLGPLPATTNPMERALADLWQRTAPEKSTAWRKRIIESTRRLLEAFLWELDNKGKRRISNPIEYIEMRRQVGAALWSADLVEHAMFVEIPERIADTRPIRVLKETFADAVHLRNDLFSYQREVVKQGEQTNAVLVTERFLGIGAQQAATLTNDLLTSRLKQFEHTAATELDDLFEEYALNAQEQAAVFTYIRGLQDWQVGAHEWHIRTSRYLNSFDKQAVGRFCAAPTGLGTSVARITFSSQLGYKARTPFKHIPYKKVGPTHLPVFYMPYTISLINPYLDDVRQHSKAWAQQMGMLNTLPDNPDIFIWDEQRFNATDLAFCSALLYPKATSAQLDMEVYWPVWGTYADDYFSAIYGHTNDLVGAKIFHARLSDFMPLAPNEVVPLPLNPVERGLIDLWMRTVDLLPMNALRFFREMVSKMVGSWLWELSNQIQNRIPDLVDFIEERRKTAGLINIPRLAQEQHILFKVHHTLTMQQLTNAALDYVCFANDIFSYQKEIEFEGAIHNSVLVIENFLGCNRDQAVQVINNLMITRMKQFEYIRMAEIPVLCENLNLDAQACEQLFNYADELQNFMCSSLRWHQMTSRYREFEIRRSTHSWREIPSGFGMSSS